MKEVATSLEGNSRAINGGSDRHLNVDKGTTRQPHVAVFHCSP